MVSLFFCMFSHKTADPYNGSHGLGKLTLMGLYGQNARLSCSTDNIAHSKSFIIAGPEVTCTKAIGLEKLVHSFVTEPSSKIQGWK